MIAAAAAVSTGGMGLETLYAPGGTLAVILTACYGLMREWRMGRQVAVDAYKAEAEREKARANREAARADAVEAERDEDIDRLERRINELSLQIAALREQHNTYIRDLQDRHRDEVRNTQRRLDNELRLGFRLREHLAAHGLALPADLDPAHPEVPPDLGVSAPPPTTSTDDPDPTRRTR